MARRNNTRTTAFIFLGVALMASGLFALFLIRTFQGYESEIARAGEDVEAVQVVVARGELTQGVTLTEEDLEIVEVPAEFKPPGSFEYIEDVKNRVPKERILAGEFIRDERLASAESGVGLNAIIPQGQRALSINVSDGSAVSGFLNPGNYVDVLVTITDEDRRNKTVTLLQAVRVLAVDSRLGSDQNNPDVRGTYKPSVTLAVTPEQAEKLAYSNIEGDVVLTLRNDIDVTGQEVNPVSGSDLLGRVQIPLETIAPTPKPVRPAPEPERPRDLLIIRGNNSSRTDPTTGRSVRGRR